MTSKLYERKIECMKCRTKFIDYVQDKEAPIECSRTCTDAEFRIVYAELRWIQDDSKDKKRKRKT